MWISTLHIFHFCLVSLFKRWCQMFYATFFCDSKIWRIEALRPKHLSTCSINHIFDAGMVGYPWYLVSPKWFEIIRPICAWEKRFAFDSTPIKRDKPLFGSFSAYLGWIFLESFLPESFRSTMVTRIVNIGTIGGRYILCYPVRSSFFTSRQRLGSIQKNVGDVTKKHLSPQKLSVEFFWTGLYTNSAYKNYVWKNLTLTNFSRYSVITNLSTAIFF